MAKINWPMTTDTYKDYLSIMDEVFTSGQSGDTLKHEFAKDRLRALPGYPSNINPDLDVVVPVIDDQSKRIVTVGSIH